MRRKLNRLQLASFLLISCGITMTTGCADNAFDFSNIDSTIGIGGDSLSFPVSSTNNMMLDQILELNNSDFITIKENGDYEFSKKSKEKTTVHPQVDKATVSKQTSQQKKVYINAPRTKTHRANGWTTITPQTAEGEVQAFKFHGNVPNEVEALSLAETKDHIKIQLVFSPALKSFVRTFQTLSLHIPSYLKVAWKDVSPNQITGNTLTFQNVSTNTPFTIEGDITALDFTRNADEYGSLSFHKPSVQMDGKLHIAAVYNEYNPNASSRDCYITSIMHMDALQIEGATGRFNPEIKMDNLGDVHIDNVPDFLTDGDVKVNLYDPSIRLTFHNDMEVPGLVKGDIVSKDKNGKELARIKGLEFTIKPQTETKVTIRKQHTGEAGEIIRPDLSNLLTQIPAHIQFESDIQADRSKTCRIELGKQYTVTSEYDINAPLAFDQNAQIVYKDTLDGWNDDLKKYEMAQNAYLSIKATAENKIPAYLVMSASAINTKGDIISEDKLEIHVSNTIQGAENDDTPTTTPLEINIKEKEKGALKQMDGLIVKVVAASSEEGKQSIVGKTINAYKQTLILRDVQIKVKGKLIGDFN